MSEDLTDKKFGRWTVLSFSHKDVNRKLSWNVECECGAKKSVTGSSLRSENSKSCGCLSNENRINSNTTHGLADSPTYITWISIKSRCSLPKTSGYENYGGRGIAVCARWKSSFENFLEDMGEKPDGTSIERKDNDGDYEPGNCKWATSKEQNRNRRSNRKITYNGETKILIEWAEQLKMNKATLLFRLDRGWSVKEAFEIPVGVRRKNYAFS